MFRLLCLLAMVCTSVAVVRTRRRPYPLEPLYPNNYPFKDERLVSANVATVEGQNPSLCLYTGYHSDCDMHMERIAFRPVLMTELLPREGEALVKVLASSVNPSDWMDLWKTDPGLPTFGSDVAGVVENATRGCDFKKGDEVWGTSPYTGFAEYTHVHCSRLGHKPAGLNFLQAASLPTVALTSFEAMTRAGAPWDNHPTILVLGGSSATGLCAIQFAKSMGAGTIITTTSPTHFELVKSLGADEVIDYHETNWWDVLAHRSINFVYDCIPQDDASSVATSIISPGGKYLTLQRNSMPRGPNGVLPTWVQNNVTAEYLTNVPSTPARLDAIRGFVETGRLRTVIDSVFLFKDLTDALQHSHRRHSTGKVVVQVVE